MSVRKLSLDITSSYRRLVLPHGAPEATPSACIAWRRVASRAAFDSSRHAAHRTALQEQRPPNKASRYRPGPIADEMSRRHPRVPTRRDSMAARTTAREDGDEGSRMR